MNRVSTAEIFFTFCSSPFRRPAGRRNLLQIASALRPPLIIRKKLYFCTILITAPFKMKKTLLLIAFVGCFTLINAQTKPDNGWWCAAEVHTAGFWYPPKVSNGIIGFTFTNGYRFSEYIRIGIGFGALASGEYGDYRHLLINSPLITDSYKRNPHQNCS